MTVIAFEVRFVTVSVMVTLWPLATVVDEVVSVALRVVLANVAVTDLSASIDSVQVDPLTPAHAPPQRLKVQPGAGVAVRTIPDC